MISIKTGNYSDFYADLLICKKNGAVMHEMKWCLTFDRYIAPEWPPSKGGHKEKATLYIANHPNYKKLLAVSYNPQSNNPHAFAVNNFSHGVNTLQIIDHSLFTLIRSGEVSTIVITALSWRNPEMLDHIMASLLKNFEFFEKSRKASITFVSLDSRPMLNELYRMKYSIWEEYLAKLTKYYESK